jgi:Holliday junction DNA helicase RuvA
MISTLQGKISFKGKNFVILDVGGVGFQVFLAARLLPKIPQIGENLKVFCYLDVGEKSLKLYGFLSYEALELFTLLREIPGVGPKAALEITAVDEPKRIKSEIEKGNERILDSIPGIGPKKAKKIILELSGKLKAFNSPPRKGKAALSKDEAFIALKNLGFKIEEIKEALASLPEEITDPQERVKEALKMLSR